MSAVLSMLQARLNLELAALGTPEMPLTKVRVPRQAKASALPAVKAVDSNKKAASTQQKKKNQQAKV